MFSVGRHILTVVCDHSTGPDPAALKVWSQAVTGASGFLEQTGPQRVVATFPVRERSQSHQGWEAVMSRWGPLLGLAEELGLDCVGVVAPDSVVWRQTMMWAQCGLPAELLWTRSAFDAFGGERAGDCLHRDDVQVDTAQGVVDLIALLLSSDVLPHQQSDAMVIGRTLERQRLEQALLQVAHGTGSGTPYLLVGDAGMGKSTLVGEACIRAASLGVREVRTHCVDYAQVRRQEPVSRFVSSLLGLGTTGASTATLRTTAQATCRAIDQQALTPLLLDALDVPLEEDERALLSRHSSEQLRDARSTLIARCVLHFATDRPLLLLFEDLHWGSDEIFNLLSHIVRHVQEKDQARSVMLLATTRPTCGPLDAHPTLDRALKRLTLGPMPSHEARMLAMRLSEHRRKPWLVQSVDFLDDAAVERCLVQAGGNPLYLSQILRLGGSEQGALGGIGSLDELLLKRTAQCTHEELHLLEVAACIGFYFDGERPLAHTDARPSDLASLEASGLIARSEDGYRFVHALIRDSVLSALPQDQRAAIQHALAAQETDPLVRAERWADARDPRAFAAFMDVAAQRRAAYQWFPALAALTRALDVAQDPTQRATALLFRGELSEEQGEGRRSLQCFQAVLSDLQATGKDLNDPLVIRAQLGILAAHRLLGRLDAAEEVIRAVRRHLDSARARRLHPLACARLDSLRGAIAFSRGQLSLCRRAHGASLRTLESVTPPMTDHRIYAQALSGMGDALYAQGCFGEARQVMQRCVDLSRKNGLGRIEVSTLHMLGIVTAYTGDAPTGLALARTCWEQACQVGDARAMLFSELNIGLTLFWDGRATDAREACRGGIRRAEWLGSSVLMGMTRAFTGHIHLAAADVTAAEQDADTALEHVQQNGERLYGGVCYGLALALAARNPTSARDGRTTERLERGLALLETAVVSHNYIYFALGAVPLAVARQDANVLWRLLNLLRDFFGAEVDDCPEGAIASLVAWVALHADLLEGRAGEDTDSLRTRVQTQPLLRTWMDVLREPA